MRETGIGSWSEADLKRALTEGVRPSGVPLAPQMPFAFYKILTAGDLDAVGGLSEIGGAGAPPGPAAGLQGGNARVPYSRSAEKPIAEDALRDPVKRGFYLATIAHCMECHSRRPDGTQDYVSWYGKGGAKFKGPFGTVLARNISSHPTAGIGAWTDAEIRHALAQGIGRDGRAFKMPMARHIYYSKMTADDLNALVAWVRTIPPIE